MKTIKYTLATLMVALVVAVVLVGCKKNTFESSGDFAMVENANSNGKGMGTGDVNVVLRGVKQYYTHTTPDGTTIVELYCVPPYLNNVCAVFTVPEEQIKNGDSQGISGTVTLYGKTESSATIPTNVVIPVRDCMIDAANNWAKFVIE